MDWKALNSRVADWKVQLYFKNLWNELSNLKFENVRIGGFNGLQKSMGWKTQFVEKQDEAHEPECRHACEEENRHLCLTLLRNTLVRHFCLTLPT